MSETLLGQNQIGTSASGQTLINPNQIRGGLISSDLIVVGSPTQNGNIFSGFSRNNYIIPAIVPDFSKNFSIVIKFKSGTYPNNRIFSTSPSEYYGMSVTIENNGKLLLAAGNGSWFISSQGTTVIDSTKYYWLRMDFDGVNSYKLYLSETGEFDLEQDLEISVTNSTVLKSYAIILGAGYIWTTNYFSGEIDISGCYIMNDSKYIWKGINQ